jgi:transcriptional antiterminator NusG
MAAGSGEMAAKWYAIQTYAGHENKVKSRIERFISDRDGDAKILQALVPTEEVIELKAGKKVKAERRLYPGYILVEMEMDEETVNIINGIQGVMKFVGAGRKPHPLTDKEMARVMGRMEEVRTQPVVSDMPYRIGDVVEIIDGPFTGFVGSVDEVFPEKGKVKVVVTLFGRPTTIELDTIQLKSV